ncbi:unnamed protein product [Rotaria sp. Silwood2]|nr:unnamed protein product [Rotaria sp. Silwood2]CAF3348239.1 unnamed protein product [Rotaria sp. Silwood2]
MPKGKEFSKEEKTLLFRIIVFVDSEKSGPKIPLNNVCDRLQVMLGLSRRTIINLRQEMSRLADQQNNTEQTEEDDDEEQPEVRPRRQSTSPRHAIQAKKTLLTPAGRKRKHRRLQQS